MVLVGIGQPCVIEERLLLVIVVGTILIWCRRVLAGLQERRLVHGGSGSLFLRHRLLRGLYLVAELTTAVQGVLIVQVATQDDLEGGNGGLQLAELLVCNAQGVVTLEGVWLRHGAGQALLELSH